MSRDKNYGTTTGGMKNWAVSDFETITENTNYFDSHKDTRVILASTIYWDDNLLKQYNPNFTEEERNQWKSKLRIENSVSIEEWWERIVSKMESQTIFFHNLAFDGYFIISYLNKIGYKNADEVTKTLGRKDCHKFYQYFLRGNNIMWIKVNVRRSYRDDKGNVKKKEFVIWFRCSKLLLNASICSLGDGIKLDKHKREDSQTWVLPGETRVREFYDREPVAKLEDMDKRYLEYCENDVIIALLSLYYFKNSFEHIDVLNEEYKRFHPKNKFNVLLKCFTSAQIARRMGMLGTRVWLRETKPDAIIDEESPKKYWELPIEDYDFMKNWMRGGLTQINHEYLGVSREQGFIGKGMMIDITSDYPAQMVRFNLPYGKVYSAQEFDFAGKYEEDYVCFLKLQVKSVKLRDKYRAFPCYPNRTGLGEMIINNDIKQVRYLIDCKVEHEAYFTKREWDILNKFYEIKYETDSVEAFYMRAAPWLKLPAFELFKIKELNKNDEGKKLGAKIAVNSMYGATCVRDTFDTSLLVDLNDLGALGLPSDIDELREKMFMKPDERPIVRLKTWDSSKEYQFRTVDRDFSNIGKIAIKLQPMERKESGTNIAAGAYITSMARCYLMETLLEIGVEHFLLCDTDSICLGHLSDEKMEWVKSKFCAKDYYLDKEYLGLGSWDVEFVKKDKPHYDGVFTNFQTSGAKQYVLWKQVGDEWVNFKKRLAGIKISDKHVFGKPSELDCFGDYQIDLYFDEATKERIVKEGGIEKVYCKSGIILKNVDKKIKITY